MKPNHAITVVQTKIYRFEFKSPSEEIDSMSYGMELMSEIDKGDNSYLISDKMTWDHDCEELLNESK